MQGKMYILHTEVVWIIYYYYMIIKNGSPYVG